MMKVTIVGAGLAGTLMALFLARRGLDVEIYDARDDPRVAQALEGKSINLTISARGMDALRRIGLDEQVTGLCTRLRGRAVHHLDGRIEHVPYGIKADEALWSVSRIELARFLCQAVATEPRVRLHFNQYCVGLDKQTAEITLQDTRTGAQRRVSSDLVVGADGAHSAVRRAMQHGECVDYYEHYVPWRYKELTIRGPSGGLPGLDGHALHVWPRGDFMMFALPNRNGSLNGVCVLPGRNDGVDYLDLLDSPHAVRDFFNEHFPDVVPYMPTLAGEFFSNPASCFATIRTSMWYYQDRVVLIGDACHSVIPFYGQGMNAAFEDCVVLDQAIARHWKDPGAALRDYQMARKENTDTLASLSIANFDELRDTAHASQIAARRRVKLAMNRVLGDGFRPLYTLVSHTTVPYAECIQQARRTELVARILVPYAWARASSATRQFATRLAGRCDVGRDTVPPPTLVAPPAEANGHRPDDAREAITSDAGAA